MSRMTRSSPKLASTGLWRSGQALPDHRRNSRAKLSQVPAPALFRTHCRSTVECLRAFREGLRGPDPSTHIGPLLRANPLHHDQEGFRPSSAADPDWRRGRGRSGSFVLFQELQTEGLAG